MSAILCRLDPNQNAPIVFVCDNWSKDDTTIPAWVNGETQLKHVPMTYYHGTRALSAADERTVAERYALAMNDSQVQIRHRLPRTEKKLPTLFSRVAENSVTLPPVHTAAPAATLPTANAGVMITNLTPPKGKAPKGTRARRGSGKAKPIDAQTLPTATPDAVQAAIDAATAQFQQQLAAIKRAAGLPA